MNMPLRDMIFAVAAIGVLGLTGCGTYSPDQPARLTAQYDSPGIEACPLEDHVLQAACLSLEEDDYDFLVPMRIRAGAPLAICGCDVEIGDPKDLANKSYKGSEVLFGASVEGSHCREFCAATSSGTGTEYRECIAICKAEHD